MPVVLKRLIGTTTAGVAIVGATMLGATPAQADGTNGPLCVLNSNAYQYDQPLGNYERTVHAGYGYRVHGAVYDGYGRLWYYGHSGESWWDDGSVLAGHVTC